ncbi:hypothetical protein L2E82_15019 [Cichorium intybus]|uniref:Uncharacterized protein n=1 Tax=Cichorium intybus TaxID=13427 RepID=A0ACB9F195_CICIN|nr:hypothetical protein L2E82_15019 [Cichorium intybus]
MAKEDCLSKALLFFTQRGNAPAVWWRTRCAPASPMTFRTNQPGSVLASLSAFWKQSMQKNRAMDLRRIPLFSARLFLFLR